MRERIKMSSRKRRNSNESIINIVRGVFDAKGWMYNYNPITGTISASFRIGDGNDANSLIMMLSIVGDYLLNCCQLPVSFSSEALTEVAEYLHRVNYMLLNGCFELDYAAQQCRYKSVLPIKGMSFYTDPESLVCDMITLPCKMWEYFGEGLEKVANGASPVEAFNAIYKSTT